MIDLEAVLETIAGLGLILLVLYGAFSVSVDIARWFDKEPAPTPEPTTLVCESAAIHPRNGGCYIITLECPEGILP